MMQIGRTKNKAIFIGTDYIIFKRKIMKTKNKTTIFSTGVHLQSVECVINGKKQWRWVATGFEDESFLNGKYINPVEYAEKQKNLIEKFQVE